MTKTKSRCTTGPWEVAQDDGVEPRLEIHGGGLRIAYVCSSGFGIAPKDEANARLIAAAPELLEACKIALRGTEPYEGYIKTMVLQAIAKAEAK